VPAVIVRVQEDVCVGHGRCYVLAADVFGADDFGHCVVLVAEIAEGDALAEQARHGAANCPEQAIVIDAAPAGSGAS
jgi:ferredoxin